MFLKSISVLIISAAHIVSLVVLYRWRVLDASETVRSDWVVFYLPSLSACILHGIALAKVGQQVVPANIKWKIAFVALLLTLVGLFAALFFALNRYGS